MSALADRLHAVALPDLKHFWAFVVWNFDTKAVEILQLTQSIIQSALEELIHSEDWGGSRNYSITITRKGEALETEYSVVPSPAKETPADILEMYKAKPINLEALLTGAIHSRRPAM